MANDDTQHESHSVYFSFLPVFNILQTFSLLSFVSLHPFACLKNNHTGRGATRVQCVRLTTFILPGNGDTATSETFLQGQTGQ